MTPRIAVALALGLSLLSCGVVWGDRVPLVTDETQTDGGCWLFYVVVDVVADPTSGIPTIVGTGAQPRWPLGYNAWRAGSEVEVRDAMGLVVLRTPGRYWMCPAPSTDLSKPMSDWVIGEVKPCADCDLGSGPD